MIKDYPRESVVVAMKWGPWIEPGKGFAPLVMTPEACKWVVYCCVKELYSV